MDGARIDRWLWAVRLVKTRSLAAQACRAGHVQINGARAKPAAPVEVGDTVRARLGGRERVVEVARLPGSRVGADLAAACLIDRSPPPPARPGPRPPRLTSASGDGGCVRAHRAGQRQGRRAGAARHRVLRRYGVTTGQAVAPVVVQSTLPWMAGLTG